jgi:hypothetical protein
MRAVVVALGMFVAVATAHANGRPPGTATINFQRGNDDIVLAGLTFGLARSEDGGATWTWMCEDAIGYGGEFDPDYAVTPTGTTFATTFTGLKVNRDTCSYGASAFGGEPVRFFSTITVASDGTIYAANTDDSDGKIYTSLDDGVTFPRTATLDLAKTWWQSIEAAPSVPGIVYLSGYRVLLGNPKEHFVLRSDDAGASFVPLPVTDFTLPRNALISIAAISKTDPALVFARVELADDRGGDAIYRSIDSGAHWTKIFEHPTSLSFLARANGDLVVATRDRQAFVSTTNGDEFVALLGAPQISCLAENAAGEVWACTQNFGTPDVPGDGFGIMKSVDLATWTGVLRYQALARPTSCAAGTVQYDRCDAELWCTLCQQLGCDPGRACGLSVDANPPPTQSGSCQTGVDGAGVALVVLAFGVTLIRRRSRC